jgi:nitrogenase-stabilizing/protective protein
MNIVEKLKRLSSAEEFFAALNVPFDPTVLNVARLHILRRMGQYLREMPQNCNEEESYEHARGTLLRAYLDFVHSTPMEQKVFRVHQQACVKPEPPLVSIQLEAR